MPMSEKQIPYPSVEAAYSSSGLSCLIDLIWGTFGRFAMTIVWSAILLYRGEHFLTWLDLTFWSFTAFLIAIRYYADALIMRGQTTSGQATPTASWRRDAIVLVGYAAVAWVAARAIARIIG